MPELLSPLLILLALPAAAFSAVKEATFLRTLLRGVQGGSGEPIWLVAPIILLDRQGVGSTDADPVIVAVVGSPLSLLFDGANSWEKVVSSGGVGGAAAPGNVGWDRTGVWDDLNEIITVDWVSVGVGAMVVAVAAGPAVEWEWSDDNEGVDADDCKVGKCLVSAEAEK